MSFVPVFVPPPPLRRTRQLARELEGTIAAFRGQNPRLRDAEIRQALGLARQRTTSTKAATMAIVGGLLAAVLLLGVLFFMRQTAGDGGTTADTAQGMVPFIASIIVLLAVVFMVKMRR